MIGSYSKFVVAALGAVAVTLQTAFPASVWTHAVTAGIAAVLVYIVPNTPVSTPTSPHLTKDQEIAALKAQLGRTP
jgi:hypothetical protein